MDNVQLKYASAQYLIFIDVIFTYFIFRYVDMIANPEVADTFRKRAKVM